MALGFFERLVRASSDHPLGSKRDVKRAITALDRSTPLVLLRDANHYLGQLESLFKESDGQSAIHALYALEESVGPTVSGLLFDFITEGNPYYLSEQVRSELDKYALELFESHLRGVTLTIGSAPGDLRLSQISALRAMRAWSLSTRLLRVYYRTLTEDIWSRGNRFHLQLLQNRPTIFRAKVADAGLIDQSPLNEYVKTLYTEALPSNNLSPAQIVFMEHIIGLDDNLTFISSANGTSTHSISLKGSTGLSKLNGNSTEAESENSLNRFISTVDACAHIELLENRIKEGVQQPQWLQTYPLAENLKISALRVTCQHWQNKPPTRCADRMQHGDDIMVVLGLPAVKAMLDVSNQVQGLAKTGARQSAETSFEALYRLEATVPNASIETWKQIDQSDTGFAATVPALLPKYRINTEIAFRYSEGLLWRAGVIRRIGRDAENHPTLGIELTEAAGT